MKLRQLTTTLVAAATLWSGSTALAQTRVQGGGASFPAPLYAKWTATYNAANPDVKIDYQGSGSGAGIKGITDRTLHFGASDAPMTPDQQKKTPAKLLHIPMVAGPEVMIYNLPELGDKALTLDGATIAGIYLGQIKTWNDSKIVALNAGLALPNKKIVVVHRSDGSGTTFIFTDYLSKVSKEWSEQVGKATSVEWPLGIGAKGNPGVAETVKNTAGAIGYVESAYAESNRLPFATQINKAGKPVRASIAGVEAAAAETLAKDLPTDMKVSITDSAAADAYPIAGFTYLLVYQDLSYLKDKALATQLVKYVNWAAGADAQGVAKDQGYAKLPKEVSEKVQKQIESITFDGHSLLK